MQKILLFSGLFLLAVIQFGRANPVEHFHLKNGLDLYVKVDKRAPVVISQVWYKVGSSYEPNGITGISHMLEHMMFQGSSNYPDSEFSKIIAANGGQENAATGYDFTYYYQKLSADKLAISFKLEADRMQNLNLTKTDFAKEIKVVREERRMRLDNNPQAMTYERFMAAAFLANPYHHPIAGWMSDLKHMTIDDVRNWYRQWYAPNNVCVVVVGEVDPQKVYALAEKYFGPVPARQLPVLKPHPPVPQLGERIVNVNMPAKLPLIIIGYNVPSIKTAAKTAWEPYALELAAYALDGGNSTRFQKYLIRGSQIASLANASYDPFARLSTVFTIYGIPGNGHSISELQKALFDQIHRLQTALVSKSELDRIKTQLIAEKTYAKDSLAYQASMIGRLESVGLSWQTGENFIDAINKITPEQIQIVSKKYFVKKRLTLAYLKPETLNTFVENNNQKE